MNRLFSPWRSRYIQSFSGKQAPDECVLCTAHKSGADEEHLIPARGKTCFVIMNLYPYNSGHVLVVPFRHTGPDFGLTPEESVEMMDWLHKITGALRKISRPDGFNIGANVGRTAGAGIDQHLHFHVVPRWNGDTNFMPVLDDTKIISEDMRETFEKLRRALIS
jgi:ATP adenylyltransferase